MDITVYGLWYLKPLSTIFQLEKQQVPISYFFGLILPGPRSTALEARMSSHYITDVVHQGLKIGCAPNVVYCFFLQSNQNNVFAVTAIAM
jgi:hypothetical protein